MQKEIFTIEQVWNFKGFRLPVIGGMEKLMGVC